MHPFSYAGEHEHYLQGTEPLTVNIDGIRTTFFICYDLRFPDVFWEVAPGTDLYVIPANWPSSRRDHWRSLLTARAIENQAYVAGVNRVGDVGQLSYAGDSCVVDPLGNLIAYTSISETVLTAEVDPRVVADTRRRFPFMRDRSSRAADSGSEAGSGGAR
jgi:predicted amidohydrolase